MVEEMAFYGIRNVDNVATSLNGYDQTAYPEGSEWNFTRFYLPRAFDAGYRLADDASLPGRLEIPMESFVRAAEIVLKDSELMDAPGYCPDAALCAHAVHHSGYVQSRHATGRVLATV